MSAPRGATAPLVGWARGESLMVRWIGLALLAACGAAPAPVEEPDAEACGTHDRDADLRLPAPDVSGVRFDVRTPLAGARVRGDGPATTSLGAFRTPDGLRIVATNLACGVEGAHPVLDPASLTEVACLDDLVPGLASLDGAPRGFFDLDGDGVDEVLTGAALWRWDGAAWTRRPFSGLDAGGCTSTVVSPAIGDFDGDGDQDLVTLRGFSALPCAETLETAVALLQGPDGGFAADAARVVDRVTPPGGWWLQGYGVMLVQPAPGAPRWLFAVGDTVGTLANDDLERLCWQHPGLWTEQGGRFEVVDALDADAVLRRGSLDVARLLEALGLDPATSVAELVEALGLDASTATSGEVLAAADAALPDQCINAFFVSDPCVQVTTSTPMGAAVVDLDGDGWLELVATTTKDPLASVVLQVDREHPGLWRDLTEESRIRWPYGGDGPGPLFLPNNKSFGWATVPLDLDGDHDLDLVSANGWDDQWFYGRDTPAPELPGLFPLEVHLNRGPPLAGETLPILQRVTDAVMATAPPISGHAICPADVDGDGRLDLLLGADFDTNGELSLGDGLPATRDGAPSGPQVILNRSDASSFTVSLSRLDGDAWWRIRFASGAEQLQRNVDVLSPAMTCHPVHQVSWRDDPPVSLEVLDRDGVVRWSTDDADALRAGRSWIVPW